MKFITNISHLGVEGKLLVNLKEFLLVGVFKVVVANAGCIIGLGGKETIVG